MGSFEIDLPFGDYTMTAQSSVFRPYRRPLFHVTSPTTLSFDIMLPAGEQINRVEIPATKKQKEAAAKATNWSLAYYGDESFPIASDEGTVYELYIRYTKGEATREEHSYTGEKDDPVFVAYNLFSLSADRVVYNLKEMTIEASGNVVAEDKSGKRNNADTMTFKIENGRAFPRN